MGTSDQRLRKDFTLTWEFESTLTGNLATVVGVDEVGRGCLAGPVYAAAVVLDSRTTLPGLNDSKKLTKRQRQLLYQEIQEKSLAVAVGEASVEEIEQLNILHAARLAMARAVLKLQKTLSQEIDVVLVDGTYEPLWPQTARLQVKTVIDGDAKCPSIAAASIVAKVERDDFMTALARQFEGYGFEKNAGYGTREHLAALSTLGPTPYHRRSFSPVAQVLQTGLNLYG